MSYCVRLIQSDQDFKRYLQKELLSEVTCFTECEQFTNIQHYIKFRLFDFITRYLFCRSRIAPISGRDLGQETTIWGRRRTKNLPQRSRENVTIEIERKNKE